jgi:VCBS repeat-containing protein
VEDRDHCAGASGSVTIDKPGVYVYVCRDHPWSIAQLTVE